MTASHAILLLPAILLFLPGNPCAAQMQVTGMVVDEQRKPIRNVACRLSGFPVPPNGRNIYTSLPVDHFTDEQGRFTIPIPLKNPFVDLQFDRGAYAPVFLYEVDPTKTPLTVVMTKGKVLKGRIVDDEGVAIPYAMIELTMPQDDNWYQRKGFTDRNGEFHFRISEPPPKHAWGLSYAGKAFKIDYRQVKPETTVTFKVQALMTLNP